MVPRIKSNSYGEVFKFQTEGDRIDATYNGRRTVKTQTQGDASVLDVDIIESVQVDDNGVESPGPMGPHSIFESKHITQLLDEANLQPGERFILCFDEIGKNGFKRFAFERAGNGNGNGDFANDDVPL